jgi:signal transduction histidine kinase
MECVKNAIKFTPLGGSITVSTSNLEALDDGDGNFTFLTDSPQQHGGGEASTLSSSASAPASTSSATPRRGPDVVPKLAISADGQALLPLKVPRSLSGSASSSATSTPRSPCARRVRAMLRIEVCDSGIGIESHILPHLFHAFEQGDASITVRFGGLGMGLAISRYISISQY